MKVIYLKKILTKYFNSKQVFHSYGNNKIMKLSIYTQIPLPFIFKTFCSIYGYFRVLLINLIEICH